MPLHVTNFSFFMYSILYQFTLYLLLLDTDCVAKFSYFSLF